MATNLGNGFTFTVPVNDTLSHTLNIYVDVSQGIGNLNASLNDGSTPDYNDSSLSNLTAISTGMYTLNYQAVTVPQILTITYTLQQGNGSGDTIASDNFNRANATGLGNASDGKNAWALTTLNGSPVWKIVSNQAVMSGTTGDTSVALLGTTTIADCDILCIIQASNVADGIGVVLRSSAKAISYYLARLVGNTFQLIYHSNGSDTILKSASVTYKINTQYNIRFRAVNQTLYARFWPNDGSQEPQNWQITVQDSHIASGVAGMYGQLSSSSDTATFDAVSAVDLSGAVSPNAYVGMHAASLPGSAHVTSSDSLVGTPSTPSGPVDLTGEGANDWAKFGYSGASSIDHKSGVTQQISNYTSIGSGAYTQNTSAVLGYSWTDGTPDTSATNTITEVDVGGVGNGFSLTVPANTNSRTLNLYVTATKAQGKLLATLSDDPGGAVTYTDSSLNDSGTGTAKEYSLTYNTASDNQTLTAQWSMLTDNNPGGSTTTYDTDTFTRANQSGWDTASDSTVWATPVSQSGTPTYSIASNEGQVTVSGGSPTTYDSDTFTRANRSGWGTASDGTAWATPVNQSGTPTYSITGNTGQVTSSSGASVSYALLGSSTQINAEAVVRLKASTVGTDTMALILRSTSVQTYYRAELTDGNTLKITKRISGTDTDLATATFSYTNGIKYWIRFRADGSNLYARAWADGSSEPISWTITVTDSSITTAGGYGIRTKVGASDIVNYDSYTVTNFASTGTTAISYALLGTSVQNNAIALVRWKSSNVGSDTIGLVLRCTASQTYYRAEVTGGNTLKITKRVSGTDTDLASATFSYSNATKYWTRFEISGNNLLARAWADGGSEPTSWSVTTIDSDITGAGGYGLRSTAASGDTVQFDSYTVTSLPTGGTPGSIGLGAATLIGNAASSPPPPPTPTPNAANVLITVNAGDALSTPWLGYGVEVDAYDHGTGTPIPVTSAQRTLINTRLNALNPQILRTAAGSASWWCPGGVVGTYNFNTSIMQEWTNVFEYAQTNTILVVVSLLSPSPFTATSTSWCTAFADLLDYLINTLGYSCIKYITGLSQPDTLGLSYSDYKNTVEPQLAAALATNHLTVPLLGPDTTMANDSWLTSSSTDLKTSLQGYARQAFPSGANDISGDSKESALKTLVSGIYANDPTNKPIIQTEMGDAFLGPGANLISEPFAYIYGLEMADFAVQIARTGVAAAIAYILDDDMQNSRWGMWGIINSPTIRPWFFTWNVLCNTVLANSTIYASAQPATNDFRVLASQSSQGAWTFVLVNRNANAQTVSVTVPSAPNATTTLQQYVYSNVAPLLVDTNGFPLSSGTVQAVLNRGLVVSMAGSSIMVLTQQSAIAATSYAVPRPPLEKRR